MRSGSSVEQVFAVRSCACLSGPPVTRTLLERDRRARTIFSSTVLAATAGSSAPSVRPRGPRPSAAAAEAEVWRKSRREDDMVG